ncbi:MAG: hypothetical protein DWH79_04015 [Planctomycetota bacterium]|nr:MAG: hypothetical protein DWH79_04015 [Planctomycetota bacterium]
MRPPIACTAPSGLVVCAAPWVLMAAVTIISGVAGCSQFAALPALNTVVLEGTKFGPPLGWAEGLPDRTVVQAGQLVIHADFGLAEQHRLIRDLETLRTDVSQDLGLPISDEPVHLYLFGATERYDAFAARQFPNFPVRRAFFVETDTTLAVFAPWQDRIAEDLRHETTHGYVHAIVPTVPLWLDEGIAEYFELPRGVQGLHRQHIDYLTGRFLEGTWRLDLARLEGLASAGEMSQDHYAESWAWVHWLLHTTPVRRRILQDYLADLRRDGKTAPLSARLAYYEGPVETSAAALKQHIETLSQLSDKPPTATD